MGRFDSVTSDMNQYFIENIEPSGFKHNRYRHTRFMRVVKVFFMSLAFKTVVKIIFARFNLFKVLNWSTLRDCLRFSAATASIPAIFLTT